MAFVSVATAAGQIMSGKFARAQANLQGDINDWQAGIERQTALKTAEMIRTAARRQVGSANAAAAAAGVVVGEGSSGEAERYIYEQSEKDAYQAILEGDRRARGLEVGGAFSRAQGRMAEAAGWLNATGTVLQGGYNMMRASGWRTMGPGWSGLQSPAPIEDRSIRSYGGWEDILKTNRSSGD